MSSRPFAGAALALMLAAVPAAAPGAETRTCTAEGVEGTGASYWNDGVWQALEAGEQIPPEAKVLTDQSSRVRIACNDGTVITVGVSTEVNIEELVGPMGRGRNVVLQLIDGIVGLLAEERTWNRFEVRTPVAIASVRSTRWLVEHDLAEGAAVFVRKGRVGVRLRDGRDFTLTEGEGITVSQGGEPGEVKSWGAARIARSTEALGFGWQ